jgi:hypothetical protein
VIDGVVWVANLRGGGDPGFTQGRDLKTGKVTATIPAHASPRRCSSDSMRSRHDRPLEKVRRHSKKARRTTLFLLPSSHDWPTSFVAWVRDCGMIED